MSIQRLYEDIQSRRVVMTEEEFYQKIDGLFGKREPTSEEKKIYFEALNIIREKNLRNQIFHSSDEPRRIAEEPEEGTGAFLIEEDFSSFPQATLQSENRISSLYEAVIEKRISFADASSILGVLRQDECLTEAEEQTALYVEQYILLNEEDEVQGLQISRRPQPYWKRGITWLTSLALPWTKNTAYPTAKKIVNYVGKVNFLFCVGNIGAYLFYGLPGLLTAGTATGTFYLGGRVIKNIIMLRNPIKKKDDSDQSLLLPELPSDPPLNDEFKEMRRMIGDGYAGKGICPLYGWKPLEEEKFTNGLYTYNIYYLVASILRDPNFPKKQKDPMGLELSLQQIHTLCRFFNIEKRDDFFKLWKDEGNRLDKFLLLINEDNEKAEKFLEAIVNTQPEK